MRNDDFPTHLKRATCGTCASARPERVPWPGDHLLCTLGEAGCWVHPETPACELYRWDGVRHPLHGMPDGAEGGR